MVVDLGGATTDVHSVAPAARGRTMSVYRDSRNPMSREPLRAILVCAIVYRHW